MCLGFFGERNSLAVHRPVNDAHDPGFTFVDFEYDEGTGRLPFGPACRAGDAGSVLTSN